MKLILKSLYQYSRNEELKKLIFKAFNKDWVTRSFLARSINIPTILEFLSKDTNEYVRAAVAQNPRTQIHVLEYLSDSNEYWRVCKAVALNENTSNSILKKLSCSIESEVRYWAKRNKNYIND